MLLEVSFDRDIDPESSAVEDKLSLSSGGLSVSVDFRGQVTGAVFAVLDPGGTSRTSGTYEHDMGVVSFGTALEGRFVVKNNGSADGLTLSLPELSGDNASDFEIATPIPVVSEVVNAGEHFSVVVRLKGSASIGNKSAMVSFSDGTSAVRFNLSATVERGSSEVDIDGDGLIEIWSLSQLDHVRYDLSGSQL